MKNKLYRETRGETMIEVVMSLALFAITMLTITVLLGTASRVYTKNYQQEIRFERQVNALNRNQVEDVSGSTKTWEFSYTSKTGNAKEKQEVVKFKTKLQSANDTDNAVRLYKFESED